MALISFFAKLLSLVTMFSMLDTTQAIKHRAKREGNSTELKNYGMLLFRAFDSQDIFGPIDALQLLAFTRQLNLYLIAETLDPVTTQPASAVMNPFNSSFYPIVLPTHTLETVPNLDVLIVPGGVGTRAPTLGNLADFIAETYPSLKYLITICTGAGLAADSGVLDGKRATTNKSAWSTVTAKGTDVTWIPEARWVVDGNIWTSAGVTAGLDLTFAFISEMYGSDVAATIATTMEYVPNKDPSVDPFGALLNVTTTSG